MKRKKDVEEDDEDLQPPKKKMKLDVNIKIQLPKNSNFTPIEISDVEKLEDFFKNVKSSHIPKLIALMKEVKVSRFRNLLTECSKLKKIFTSKVTSVLGDGYAAEMDKIVDMYCKKFQFVTFDNRAMNGPMLYELLFSCEEKDEKTFRHARSLIFNDQNNFEIFKRFFIYLSKEKNKLIGEVLK